MTGRRTEDDARGAAARAAKKAQVRKTKGSVHEAIGKLIGDDAASAEGAEEKRAAADERPDDPSPRR